MSDDYEPGEFIKIIHDLGYEVADTGRKYVYTPPPGPPWLRWQQANKLARAFPYPPEAIYETEWTAEMDCDVERGSRWCLRGDISLETNEKWSRSIFR